MSHYELGFTVPSPGSHASFVEFSPNGRFLAVGDRDSSSLYILDENAGFHQTLMVATQAIPTAIVWETSFTFYLGLDNGSFFRYQIDGGKNILVEGVANDLFRGPFPITAMALDVEFKTLVLSVGPGVFALRRVRKTNEFRSITFVSSRFSFPSDPGSPAPRPRSICFTADNTLIVTFCRQHIVSVALDFLGDSYLNSSFQTARLDYTGLPVLKAIASAGEKEVQHLTRCWIYGHDDAFPFLFINGGSATVSGTAHGTATIQDTITLRETQTLDHTGVSGDHVHAMAYHVSKEKYSIATANRGEDAKIKIWTSLRTPEPPFVDQAHRRSLSRKALISIALLVALVFMTQSQVRIPAACEILWFSSQLALMLVQLFIYFGYIILEAVEDVVVGFAGVVD